MHGWSLTNSRRSRRLTGGCQLSSGNMVVDQVFHEVLLATELLGFPGTRGDIPQGLEAQLSVLESLAVTSIETPVTVVQ